MEKTIKKFGNELNYSLIEDFRDVVNEGEFAYHYFINKDGRNQFSPMCSCMDWISVSIRYIKHFPAFSDDIDVKAMQFYSLVSSIDIVVEAVTQLHRIIMDEGKKLQKWPFKDSSYIFTDKVEYLSNKDDDGYFGEIRSIFGAHPTNLRNDNGEGLFASWPHPHPFNMNDFTVSIYSNRPGSDDVIFGIKIDEVLKYLNERYSYITKLKNILIGIRKHHYKKLSKVIIPVTENIYEELRVLHDEVTARQDNDYYRMELHDITHLFTGVVTEAHLIDEVSAFRDKLYPIVAEIRKNLQSMNLVDLITTKGIMISRLPDGALNYEIPKIFRWLHSGNADPMAQYYINNLNKYSNGKYCFNMKDDASTTLLKLRMMMYSSQVNKD